MIQPEERTFSGLDGVEKTFVLTRFPAIQGREIITQYPITAAPKLGEYKANEELMLKMLAHVYVPMPDGNAPMPLKTRALIDSHIPDWEMLAKIEMAMIQKNTSFFQPGKIATFSAGFAAKAQQLISKMLTDFSAQSSKKN